MLGLLARDFVADSLPIHADMRLTRASSQTKMLPPSFIASVFARRLLGFFGAACWEDGRLDWPCAFRQPFCTEVLGGGSTNWEEAHQPSGQMSLHWLSLPRDDQARDTPVGGSRGMACRGVVLGDLGVSGEGRVADGWNRRAEGLPQPTPEFSRVRPGRAWVVGLR